MSITQTVLDALADGPHSAQEIADATGLQPKQITGSIATLKKRKQVKAIKRGVYGLPSEKKKSTPKKTDERPKVDTVPTLPEFLAETFNLDVEDVSLAMHYYLKFVKQ